jgi:hypothetical protein
MVHELENIFPAKLYTYMCSYGQAVEEELEDEVRRSHFGDLGAWCLANLCGKDRFVREGTLQYKRFNQGG